MIKEKNDTLLKNDSKIWNVSLSNEMGRLTQGISKIIGIQKGYLCKYGMWQWAFQYGFFWLWITLGGDVRDYLGDTSSPAESLIETKLLPSGVISKSSDGVIFLHWI